ncbi:sigma-54-dependent Fis family transcriptional regulator [Arhodomonas sp. AD133]|uniref:sigma-54-dependent Fis family transcriptional regulator n=1 Tax=Arhodomonas sp. AD133 TaxID=3415009 RepID=UPI003EB94797
MALHTAQRTHIDTVLARAADEPANAGTGERPDIITRSWQRCVREYGLDPSRPQSARIVTHERLREHRERVDEFLSVARSGVEQLYAHIAELDYVLLLCDDRGITVEYLGNPRDDRPLREAGLYLGADWNERHAGTCAVGTCLEEGVALTCHRVDHFDASHITLTCTSAPVFSPQGDLLAVLDVSALRSPTDKSSQNFALQLVNHYARMIEDAYFLRRYRDKHVFRFGNSREMVHVNGQNLLAMEEDGTIVAANTNARRLLRSNPPHYAGVAGEAPLNITHLFDCELTDVLSIPFATDDQVRAFHTNHAGEIYFATLIEPKKRHGPAHDGRRPAETRDLPELDRLAADDPTMRKTIACAKRLRNEPVNVLIVGETGTGKERLARALHDSSDRAGRPFIAVNCAAIPESLIESELFGYQPGTFTGARSKGMKGLIQQSDGGTLFLDEIGDMPLHLQTRLLRALAEKEILPLGAERPVPVDLRVVAATHRDIRRLIDDGAFREDLYYRLNGATLKLPPLRARADKQYVIRSVFEGICRERGAHAAIRGDAMSALLAHDWPGNIRELNNALRFALATCEADEIALGDLPDDCAPLPGRVVAQLDAGGYSSGTPRTPSDAHCELHELLREQRWNITAVARLLGVSRPTVYRRMRKLGIVPPNLRDG